MTTEQRRAREALLDEMLADSFPASDAPSFTPVTGVGGGETAISPDSTADSDTGETPSAPHDAADSHLAGRPA